MKKFVLGRKIGMTQIMSEQGVVTPVTVLEVGPCTVVKVLNKESNGYNSVLLGYEEKKKSNKPESGFFEKVGISPKKILKEFRTENIEEYTEKKEILVDIFEENEMVNVRGKSIGKGFQGTIKRHNFTRGPKTHGSKNYRKPGSIGGGTTPGRVLKGKKMAGQMGNKMVFTKNLLVVGINKEKNLIYLKGAVPGKKNNLVMVFS
jgi:large subunit ribosomal protein L3